MTKEPKMTLDDAIQHCREKEDCSQCGQEHRQLRKWLEELKRYKENLDRIKPHGRLIDADRFLAWLQEFYPNYTVIMSGVKNAKTIIEAEE